MTSIAPAATRAVMGVCASTSPSIEIGSDGRVSTFRAVPLKLTVSWCRAFSPRKLAAQFLTSVRL